MVADFLCTLIGELLGEVIAMPFRWAWREAFPAKAPPVEAPPADVPSGPSRGEPTSLWDRDLDL